MICYVISLQRHPNRLAALKEAFSKSDLGGLELRWFPAIDPTANWEDISALVAQPALDKLATVERLGFRATHAELPSRGAIGCALSHLSIWLDILKDPAVDPQEPYLVLEDDAVLPKRSLHLFNKGLSTVPAGWDILLLGYRTPRPSMVTKHLSHLDIRYFWGMHAYLIRKAGARKILETAVLPITMQIDSYLSALAMSGELTVRALPRRLTQQQSWQSSIQIDHAYERTHAKPTHSYSKDSTRGPVGEDFFVKLAGLRTLIEPSTSPTG